ncbi:MAG: DUF4870 domain-containing protein [Dehalococcoidia bacterium]|nr:DUF4870 domain-containing protein [Dehalococcoidia bacterium]
MASEKTGMGLEPNVAGLLCYLVGWVTGLVFFLMEKDNKFVRFHAMQSIVVSGALMVIGLVLSPIMLVAPLLSVLIWPLFYLLCVALWIVLMVKAYQNKMFKVPWAGNFAEKHI